LTSLHTPQTSYVLEGSSPNELSQVTWMAIQPDPAG